MNLEENGWLVVEKRASENGLIAQIWQLVSLANKRGLPLWLAFWLEPQIFDDCWRVSCHLKIDCTEENEICDMVLRPHFAKNLKNFIHDLNKIRYCNEVMD